MAESIVTVVLEVVKCLAPPTERQISYLRSYNNNFENLKNEIENLKNDSESVKHKADEAKRNGEEIENNVQEWLARVSKIISEVEKFVGEEVTANMHCLKGLCPNLKTRHRLSKEAVRLREAIVKLREAGSFDRISYRSIPEDTWFMSKKDYYNFESRKTTLTEILGALKDPDVNMLGIYGMGGIGKTTLAKEVARQAEIDKLFDQVVFTEVSQSQDIRKIQGEIADKLGLSFHGESESGRARSLCSRLKKEKRILVILDNIWENLDLLAVGIPHGDEHKGCKILLTARSEDVLSNKMDSKQNFPIGFLTEKEAWCLFKKMVGDCIEGSEFKSVATDVAKECAGLPISIATVARALRNKKLFEWTDALEQLRRPSLTNFMHIQPTACAAIQMSYNKLEGEELKKIFLLIGYADIQYIDDLFMYAMGLGIFQGINKMEEARARVRTLVQKLKASCMLLDHENEDDEEWFSMHDVVRDVAILIASREQNVFLVTRELVNGWEWPSTSTIKLFTSIVLDDVETNMLPEVLECPQLELFIACAAEESSLLTIPENLFTSTIQVRVIDLTEMNLLSMPSSLGLLTNLRTLCLCRCKLRDLSIVGDLKNLEILSLQGSNIKELPVEVGQLTRLRWLDLRDCEELEVIPPNVLPKLSHLEDLHIFDFDKWGEEVGGLKNASIDELKHLPNLTSLELQIKDVNILPRGLFFEKLERYKICIGDRVWKDISTSNYRTFRLELNTNICLKDGLIVQLHRIEELSLAGFQEQDFSNFVYEFVKVGSYQLKHLQVEGRRESSKEKSTTDMQSKEIISEDNAFFAEKVALPNLETLELYYLNVERIWQSQLAAMSCGIQKLAWLRVHNCRNLRCMFPSSIVNSFARLQELVICNCNELEEIIAVDQEERKKNIIMFPQLQYLFMRYLEKLKGFCNRDVHIQFPSLKVLAITECPKFTLAFTKVVSVFPNLESLRVDAKRIAWILQLPEDMVCKLKHLDVILDESVTISSLDDFFKRFHTIQILQMDGGKSVVFSNLNVENELKATIREVNKFADVNSILKHSTILENLEILQISKLEYFENLINLMPSSTTFQKLTTLEVWFCDGLIKLLTSSTIKNLVQLRQIYIGQCNMLTEIVSKDDDQGDTTAKDEIVFNNLKELVLFHLQSLTSFCSGNCTFKFPCLERLVVENCPEMKIFSGGELNTPSLGKIQRYRNSKSDWTWKGDLNTTIPHLYLETMEADKEENDKSTQLENNAESSGSRQRSQQGEP